MNKPAISPDNQSTRWLPKAAVVFGEFLLLPLVAPLCLAADVAISGNRITEISVTEILQEFLLFVAAWCFWKTAIRHRELRGFCILVGGFFTCMLIREADYFLDYVWRGFWLWPALCAAAGSIGGALIFHRKTVLKPVHEFLDTKPWFYIGFGLMTVLVFSRVFASRKLLWDRLLVSGMDYGLKSVLQEGLDLFGYGFIAYGAVLFVRRASRRIS